MPERVQLSRRKGWRMPENTVSVARPGRWGNPYPVEIVGQARAVEMFEDEMRGFFDPGKLADLSDEQFGKVYAAREFWRVRLNWGAELRAGARSELRGKNLACWCALPASGEPDICHAAVLLRLANPVCEAVSP